MVTIPQISVLRQDPWVQNGLAVTGVTVTNPSAVDGHAGDQITVQHLR